MQSSIRDVVIQEKVRLDLLHAERERQSALALATTPARATPGWLAMTGSTLLNRLRQLRQLAVSPALATPRPADDATPLTAS